MGCSGTSSGVGRDIRYAGHGAHGSFRTRVELGTSLQSGWCEQFQDFRSFVTP